MTHPDSTTAFDADAARDSDDVAALKARLAKYEQKEAEANVDLVDADGNPIGGAEADISKIHTADIAGETWSFHAPKTQALMAFGLGTANQKKGALVMRTMSQFLGFHLLEEDYERLLERMADPQDEFSDDDFGDLMNKVVEVAANSSEAQAPKNGPRRRR